MPNKCTRCRNKIIDHLNTFSINAECVDIDDRSIAYSSDPLCEQCYVEILRAMKVSNDMKRMIKALNKEDWEIIYKMYESEFNED